MTRAIPSVVVAYCGNELVAVCSETSTVIWGKPINEIAKECVGWFRDAAGLVGESEEFTQPLF